MQWSRRRHYCPSIQTPLGHEWRTASRCCLPVTQVGKASGLDGISAEHLKYAHPSIVFYLKQLFNLILIYGHVPDAFGQGVVVPLLKDRLGDTTDLNNYRAITVSCVISKVFELCITNKFKNLLCSHLLQFGFKKSSGCQNAIFTMQQCINYFTQRGSTVFISALDASKALTEFVMWSFLISSTNVTSQSV